ncbi:copper ABC transporter permease [Bacillus sp. HMF5848]|uniref:ABC transporter permease subunit n=1 Tax=Bacillus sp. HMF5848 TaxID=2495421 RepID=UPI000F7670C5|nr:ABC transporter permease subunit [Bacillus sp. HMF5848]RSK26602.1 copper ABC transporter permease [Bacillus sp. HMF5848]
MNYILKEWKEQARGKGIWLSLLIIMLLSVFLLLEARTLPVEQGFTVLLLSMFEMNMFVLPLLSIFIASFSIMQEKELKTMMILLTKHESYISFLAKKSIAIQLVVIAVIVAWYFLFALVMKVFLYFNVSHFLLFILAVSVMVFIFNQIGVALGSICSTRMQLLGANILTWFSFVFLIDLMFLQQLSNVTYDNVQLFAFFYFLDPLHTIPFYLETSLEVFSLEHMSRLMSKMMWASPTVFMIMNLVIWSCLSFVVAIVLQRRESKS